MSPPTAGFSIASQNSKMMRKLIFHKIRIDQNSRCEFNIKYSTTNMKSLSGLCDNLLSTVIP